MSDYKNKSDFIVVERRDFMKVSLFAFGALLMGRPASVLAEATGKTPETLSFDDYIQKLTPLAEKLVNDKNTDEEAYLKQLEAWVKALGQQKIRDPNDRRIQFTTMHKKVPIVVYQIRMKTGASLPFHDHRQYNGVIKVLEGEAHVRNYDIMNWEPSVYQKEKFQIKQTQDIVLKAGDVSSLSRVRDNIHDVKAGEKGVVFLDIFTRFNETATSKYLLVNETPVDAPNKIFDARWKHLVKKTKNI